MFRFAHPIYLYFLIIVLVIALLHYWGMYQRRKRIARFGDPSLVRLLFVDVSRLRAELKLWLPLLGLSMFILALARPQNGTKQSERERYGIEAIVCLDVSNSMLAQDVHPSRLEKSKRLVANMMSEMKDDQIGLNIFAGDAFIQLPITSDFVSAKMFLDQISPDMIATQGTDIKRAIELAMQSFTHREGVNRAIFIITDGEDNEGGAVEAAAKAAEQGVHVFVLGVGDPQGAHIPIPGTTQNMLDESGNEVLSCLNEKMCNDIATAGKGAYIYVDNSTSAQEALNNHVEQLGKMKLANAQFSEYNEKFQLFILLGLLFLVLDIFILARENHLFKKIHLFKGRSFLFTFALLSVSIGALTSCSEPSQRDYLRRGNRSYRQLRADSVAIDSSALDQAITAYKKALDIDSTFALAHYNLSNAQLFAGKDSVAFTDLKKAQSYEKNPLRLAHIHHNQGVILQASKQYAEAIELYKEALRLNPQDNETRYNLALCQWLNKKNQDNQPQGGGGGGQGEDQNEEKKQDSKDKQGGGDKQEPSQEQPKQNPQNSQNNPAENKSGQKERESDISKEAAEQMLNAAMQNERRTQERLNRYKQRSEQQENTGQRRLQKKW